MSYKNCLDVLSICVAPTFLVFIMYYKITFFYTTGPLFIYFCIIFSHFTLLCYNFLYKYTI